MVICHSANVGDSLVISITGYSVSKLVVYNRIDCCQDRIKDAQLIYSNDLNATSIIYQSSFDTVSMIYTFPVSTSSADYTPQYFSYSGTKQTYTVPAGITRLKIDACGGKGASITWASGGIGGYISTIVTVTLQQKLYVYVGGSGTSGGFNGGGKGNAIGGGGTDIRTSDGGDDGSSNVNSRIAVAGGGGVGGGNYLHGGNGGGDVGGITPFIYQGGGGTQSAGGSAGWRLW